MRHPRHGVDRAELLFLPQSVGERRRAPDPCVRARAMPPPEQRGPQQGRDVHVVTTTQAVTTYMEKNNRTAMICFRCGQHGHARAQCMTYKVRLCRNYANGGCAEPVCTFAHGEAELRTPWRTRCVRVIKHEGQFVCMGCNSTEHTFRKCPIHQDLIML